MHETDNNSVISLNILTVLIVFVQGYAAGLWVDWLSLIVQPLFVTETVIFVLSAWTLCGLFAVQQFPRIQVWNIMKCVALLALSTLLFHIIAVLYGARLTESVAETFHFACLLTTVTTLPCCCVLGPNLDAWLRVFAQNRVDSGLELNVQISSCCAVVGAWLGAFPIPLDWDRPWQVWPISCVIGTMAGYSVGLFAACFLLRQRHKQFPKNKLG